MASDLKYPRWLPRALRPVPPTLRRARRFTGDVLGDRLEEFDRIPGWLHPDQAASLCYFAHQCPGGPIVEIGSFRGKSTVLLARGMKETNTLHAIDPHLSTEIGNRRDRATAGRANGDETSWTAFHETLATWQVADRVDVIRKYSHDARAVWDGTVVFAWIDGDHSYEAVKQDIEDWTPLIVPGGYVAFHDTHPDYPSDPPGSVRAAITDSGLPTSSEFETVLELRNLWILRRRQ